MTDTDTKYFSKKKNSIKYNKKNKKLYKRQIHDYTKNYIAHTSAHVRHSYGLQGLAIVHIAY